MSLIDRNEEQLMSLARLAGLLLLLLTAGCAGTDSAPKSAPPAAGVAQEKAPAPEPHQVSPTQEKATASRPAASAPKPDRPAAIETVPTSPVPAKQGIPQPEAPVAKPQAPDPQPPAKAAASPAPKEPAPKKESAVPAAAKPTLDLALLEKRLKETPAIGVFTKLTLKNQVDDLLEQFKAHYQGRAKTTLAALRQPYDQLILKVLSLLQDGDPPLARAIVESREAIWGILSDPEKFKNL